MDGWTALLTSRGASTEGLINRILFSYVKTINIYLKEAIVFIEIFELIGYRILGENQSKFF